MHGKPTGRSFLSETGMLLAFLLLLLRPAVADAQSGIYLSYKGAPLKTVLESISRQSDFRFVYTDELKIDTYLVSIESYNELPDILFRKIFNPLAIIYQIRGNQVVVGAIWVPMTKLVFTHKSNSNIISGIVTDQDSIPLKGVKVTDRTTGNTADTDADGKYSILALEGDIITFGIAGMADFTLKLGKEQKVDVTMKPDIELYNQHNTKKTK